MHMMADVVTEGSVPATQRASLMQAPMVCFLVVFPVDMFHDGWRIFFHMSVWSFEPVQFFLVLRPQKELTIDPFACHITVLAQLYGRSFTTSVKTDTFGPQISGCLVLDLVLYVISHALSVFSRWLHSAQNECD